MSEGPEVETSEPPPEVSRLVAAITSIPGVTWVEVEKTFLPNIAVADLSLPGSFAFLPIAALRRSNGALPQELLLSINFRIERSEAGLKALEFLSWWTRDQSRGGTNMQIRSVGLPPRVENTIQLGRTLSFTIDWFYAEPSEDIGKLLSAIDGIAKDIEFSITMYARCFEEAR